MDAKKLRFEVIGALSIVCTFILLCNSISHAQMCQVIRIDQTAGGISERIEIFPEKITVPVGTCTVWVNWIENEEVYVSFRENAEPCSLSTEAPSGFEELNLKSGETCYMSDKLSRGRSASLVWKKPGVYKYTLEYADQSSDASVTVTTGSVKRAAVGIIEVK